MTKSKINVRFRVSCFWSCVSVSFCQAVTSKVTRHSSSQDFLKGETNDVVIGSRGTIQLGPACRGPRKAV